MKKLINNNQGFIEAIVIFIVVIIIYGCSALINYKWPEIYTTNGYFVEDNPETEDGDYYIGEERINLWLSKTVYETEEYESEEGETFKIRTGTYQLELKLPNNLDEVIIHDLSLSSNLGNTFDVSEPLPITVEPSIIGSYANVPEKHTFNHDFLDEFEFDFDQDEIIFVEIDIELTRENRTERDTVIFELVPRFHEVDTSGYF